MTTRKRTARGGDSAAKRNAAAAETAEFERFGPPPTDKWMEEDRIARAKGPGNRGTGAVQAAADAGPSDATGAFKGESTGRWGQDPASPGKPTL